METPIFKTSQLIVHAMQQTPNNDETQTLANLKLEAIVFQENARRARLEYEARMGRLDMAGMLSTLTDVWHHEQALKSCQVKCAASSRWARHAYEVWQSFDEYLKESTRTRDFQRPSDRVTFAQRLKGWMK